MSGWSTVAPAATTDRTQTATRPSPSRGPSPAELVDGGDQQRWRQPVDLLVTVRTGNGLRRPDRLLANGQRARLVAAEHVHSPNGRVGLDLRDGDRVPAPMGKRWISRTVKRCDPYSLACQLLVSLSTGFGLTSVPTHSPDTERFDSPRRLVLSTSHLRGAHQRGRTLELLGGQETQRVAHQDGDPLLPSRGPSGRLNDAWRRRIANVYAGKAEVCLGLAHRLGRTKSSTRGFYDLRCAGMQPDPLERELHEDERQLERIPRRRFGAFFASTSCRGCSIVTDESDARAAGNLRGDTLVTHDTIH